MTILSSREEERTKRRRPRGLARGMEPHQIAWPTSAKKNTVERRGGVVWEDEKRTAGGLHWRRRWVKELTEKGCDVVGTSVSGAPDDSPDRRRQRTSDDEKESRRRAKMHEDRSGWSTMAVGGGKSGRWTARQATRESGGRRRTQ